MKDLNRYDIDVIPSPQDELHIQFSKTGRWVEFEDCNKIVSKANKTLEKEIERRKKLIKNISSNFEKCPALICEYKICSKIMASPRGCPLIINSERDKIFECWNIYFHNPYAIKEN